MSAEHCPECGAPSWFNRQLISWEMEFMARALGDTGSNDGLSQNEACGAMWILYGLAKRVYPEGQKKQPDSDG